MAAFGSTAYAAPAGDLMGEALLQEALRAKNDATSEIGNDRYISVIDYRVPSNVPRYFLIDTDDMTAEAFLVSHGRGSDPDFDGMADRFSNIEGSKMSSLGAFVTGATYYGAHGLSLKLKGLSPQNDLAEKRLIVIHGADYVHAGRTVLRRSWGCPAMEREVAERIIPLIKGGTFLYVVGTQREG
ncbi:MAG: murein L,D-transpeptidase catalytic domain family protein [Henriciella sp.]|nr:murein L,D-transpeptidase catalytic domain family protein [Henriciella sp.]